ncbi:hypothetical protein CKO42_08335 [Lamprobacter modestohalophilus]|uniref:RNA polymerase sigma factor 70 region 4 type 2 domain-containing protein n=1 Tax=Lamprobacter modestohalophilus TaxID=1064514 RepID=A0A9X0W7K3_9GAMM|nr:sigma-70 family RNA polymerase sigma factor [Lamprobacter modestohalophilus]MBK1618443.1 hypothetical protein [Lamprobacter modestohalophilus]
MAADRAYRRVNLNARLLVRLALEKGYSYAQIGELTGVSEGSVKRWHATGRADADRIKELEALIGPVRLSPEALTDQLIRIYRERRRRYRLGRAQLKSLAGRRTLKAAFIEQLSELMLDRGYYLLDGCLEQEEDFIVISLRQLNKLVPYRLGPQDIDGYLPPISEAIEDNEEGL